MQRELQVRRLAECGNESFTWGVIEEEGLSTLA